MCTDDPLANVLYIDLSKKRFWVEKRQDLFTKYIGGAGVATQLLHEECPEGADPFGPDNPIVLAVGPLTALFPLASKTVAMFKSPHAGNSGENHAGGAKPHCSPHGWVRRCGHKGGQRYPHLPRYSRRSGLLPGCFLPVGDEEQLYGGPHHQGGRARRGLETEEIPRSWNG